ncbi:MAG: apolipoprotein N-acyltransferase, partial [Moorella sp. (in: Bacteria)]|nr:apolipoprotein N-acyltransferase [Moorella sp. (in: firmicutes)]
LLMLFEWLRGHIFSGFPWNLFGYTWAEILPMAQLVSIGGIYGLSLLTLFWGALAGFLFIWPAKRPPKAVLLGSAIITMSAGWLYGQHRLDRTPTVLREDVAIRLVQPNISQEDKWAPEKAADNFQKLINLSQPNQTNRNMKTLIVWPETAMSQAYMTRTDPGAIKALQTLLQSYQNPVYLVSGMAR